MRQSVLRLRWILLLVLALPLVQASNSAAAERKATLRQSLEIQEQAKQAVEQMRADRLAAARPLDMYSPFYSVAGADDTVIYLLNAVAEPVRIELAALNPHGEVLPLGEFEIGVTRHLTLPLRDVIRPAGERFYQGSLRLSLIGDAYTVQAWGVVNRGRQFAEFQFESRYKAPRNDMGALWDAAASGGRPVFRLVNVGNASLSYHGQVVGHASPIDRRPRGQDDDGRPGLDRREAVSRVLTGTLEPGQSHRLEPGATAGFLRIEHDGERGDLRVAGLLEGRHQLSLIPVVRREDWEGTRIHETIRVTWDPAVEGSALLTLFNVSDLELEATVQAFDVATGTRLLGWNERIAPGRLVTVSPGSRLAAKFGKVTGRDVRLRVAASGPGLIVTGKSRQGDGTIDDMSLLQPEDAHASGSYPMLPLESHEVFLTLLNLGDEPSDVVAQFYWEGGTYAYGPIRVDAKSSYRLAVDDVVQHGRRDMLGQTLNRDHRHGFLKWSARGGSKALLGRTEARPRGGRDTFGFNCTACCGEVPSGVVVPSSVEFFVGQTPAFQTAVEIDTCNGTMGPFPTSASSFSTPSPFTWNGLAIGASSAAQETTSFFGTEEGTLPGTLCEYRLMPISGLGSPSSCITLLKKTHHPTAFWSNSQACTLQVGGEPSNTRCSRCQACCGAQKSYRLCRRQNQDIVQQEYQVCITHCQTDHCI